MIPRIWHLIYPRCALFFIVDLCSIIPISLFYYPSEAFRLLVRIIFVSAVSRLPSSRVPPPCHRLSSPALHLLSYVFRLAVSVSVSVCLRLRFSLGHVTAPLSRS